MRTPRTAVLSPAAPLRLAHALAWLLLSLFLSVASAQELVAVPPLQARVTDLTGTLAADRVAALDAQLRAFEQRKGVQIAVLMVRSTRPEPVEQYALRVVEQWKLGRRKVDDGALLLVAKDDRTVRIEVGYGIEGALSDVVSRRIIDEVITPRLRQGDFDGGIAAGAEQIMRVIDGEALPAADPRRQGQTNDIGQAWPFLFVAALMLGGVLLALCWRIRLPRLALVAGALLYGLALIGGSYGKPLLGGEWALLTRNGPFFSLLFVALGAYLKARNWRPDTALSVRLLGAGLALYALEAWGLLRFAEVPLNRHDFLLGSIPWALGLFGLLLANPDWGAGSWLARQAPKVLGLYCVHMMLVVWLMVFGPQGKHLWWELLKVPVLLVLSLLACRLLATNRISGWLLRAR